MKGRLTDFGSHFNLSAAERSEATARRAKGGLPPRADEVG